MCKLQTRTFDIMITYHNKLSIKAIQAPVYTYCFNSVFKSCHIHTERPALLLDISPLLKFYLEHSNTACLWHLSRSPPRQEDNFNALRTNFGKCSVGEHWQEKSACSSVKCELPLGPSGVLPIAPHTRAIDRANTNSLHAFWPITTSERLSIRGGQMRFVYT